MQFTLFTFAWPVRLPRAVTAVLSVLVLGFVCQVAGGESAAGESHEPAFQTQDLFVAGDAGYTTYRIPAIAATRKGTILVACAARLDGFGDWADIDTMFRRSTDGGAKWSAPQVLTNCGKSVVDNATFIVDPQSDTIHLMYQVDYAHAYVRTSDDEGATWSEPRELTTAFETFRTRDGYDWKVLAMGPGHGIVLQNGRFLVPVWLATEKSHRPSISATIYSDDRGQTWRAGDVIVETTDATPNPSEHMLVELSDGRVMTNIRCESKKYRRLVSVSPDGISRWSKPKFDDELFDPICMASLTRLGGGPASSGANRVLFANPDSAAHGEGQTKWGARERRNLTVCLSTDEGRTWPIRRVIEPGPSGYSDMAVGPDGTVYLLFERSGVDKHDAFHTGFLTFARFNLAWIAEENKNGATE